MTTREPEHIRTIRLSASRVTHDEWASEYEMRNTCPNFFRTPHGKRETYSVHRGFLIVRNTRQYTGCKPVRCTQIYLFLRDQRDMLHIDFDGNSTAQAERRIDRILKCGAVDETQAEPVLPGEKIDLTL